jgi:hypothetical protein
MFYFRFNKLGFAEFNGSPHNGGERCDPEYDSASDQEKAAA